MQPLDIPSPVETLTLTPDNPCNTTITTSSGHVLYTAVTEHTKQATFTQVRSASDDVLGVLEWRDVLADRVTIGGGKPVPLYDWVKKSLVPFRDQATFSDDSGRRYKWKGITADTRTMELYAEDDKFKAPIARYHRSRRQAVHQPADPPESPVDARGPASPTRSTYSLSPTLTDDQPASPTSSVFSATSTVSPHARPTYFRTPGSLSLTPRAKEIQDTVVLSLLFLEKQSRTQSAGLRDDSTMVGYMVGAGVAGAC